MLITVPSAGAVTLDTLLSAPDLQRIYDAPKDGYALGISSYQVGIQNLGAQDIYFSELGEVAAVASAIKINNTNGQNSVTIKRLSDLSLISNGAPNVNVRIIVRINWLLQ